MAKLIKSQNRLLEQNLRGGRRDGAGRGRSSACHCSHVFHCAVCFTVPVQVFMNFPVTQNWGKGGQLLLGEATGVLLHAVEFAWALYGVRICYYYNLRYSLSHKRWRMLLPAGRGAGKGHRQPSNIWNWLVERGRRDHMGLKERRVGMSRSSREAPHCHAFDVSLWCRLWFPQTTRMIYSLYTCQCFRA